MEGGQPANRKLYSVLRLWLVEKRSNLANNMPPKAPPRQTTHSIQEQLSSTQAGQRGCGQKKKQAREAPLSVGESRNHGVIGQARHVR